MTPRTGAVVVLVFAGVWLWLGAAALSWPWAAIVGVVGGATLLAVGWRVLRARVPLGRTGRFDRRKFAAAVAFEVIAANVAAWQLGRIGHLGYVWPALGIVVALHFIGLWWASHDPRYLTLTLTMLAVNVVACLFREGSTAMLATSGIGSSAALAAALVRRR